MGLLSNIMQQHDTDAFEKLNGTRNLTRFLQMSSEQFRVGTIFFLYRIAAQKETCISSWTIEGLVTGLDVNIS